MNLSFAGLEVAAPKLEPVTEAEVIARFQQRLRAFATKRARAPAEAIVAGDDLTLNIVAGCEGALIPFSTRFDWQTTATAQPDVPGLIESLIGENVGATVRLELTLPPHYTVESLRGKRARFAVDLIAACEVTPLPPGEFARIGLGHTLRDVMLALHRELDAERAAEQLYLTRELAFDAVLERARVSVAPALVDDDIQRAWQRLEGAQLKAHDFGERALAESLEGWLHDPATRIAAQRRVALSRVFQAVVENEGLVLTPEKFDALIAQYGVDTQRGKRTEQMAHLGIHLLGMQHVLAQLKLT